MRHINILLKKLKKNLKKVNREVGAGRDNRVYAC